MTAIRLNFPGGRYHATPWGRHVNEGVVEWPPSPYRLLRALYDVWKRKCFTLEEDDIRAVLQALAETPPRFVLPSAVATHTRSYLSANSKDPTDKNLVFDAFLALERPHQCYIWWPHLDLSQNEQSTLRLLLHNLNYLGRSESWVQAELWQGGLAGRSEAFASDKADQNHTLEPVACPLPKSEYQGERAWLEALTFSTANQLKERVSSPPLLRHVNYAVPTNAISVDPHPRILRKHSKVYAVLLGLDATVLPLVTSTMEIAEQLRVRLMGAHKKRLNHDASKVSSLFSGKTSDGQKRLDHGHVYILPRGNELGRINRILIMSRLDPFKEDELDAVRCVRELWQSDGRPVVRCVVTWQGGLDEGERQPKRVVESATPFVPPRHWRRGREFTKFIEDEVHRECQNHGIGAKPVRVDLLKALPGLYDVIEYRRNRKNDMVRPGYALRLTFDAEVLAPFAIGYGAHFGLGQFQTAD